MEGFMDPQAPSVTGSVKDEPQWVSWASGEQKYESAIRARANIDKDFLCPICIQTMKDAFLTACGHSFCYMCITTHLSNRSNCPCCARYLTNDQLFPNFLLTKELFLNVDNILQFMKKASASQLVSNASPAEQLRMLLQQGAELPVKELDSLLHFLGERKRKLDQEEAESNIEVLLDFLHRSRHHKQEELHELQDDLQFLKEDIMTVERRRQEFFWAKDSCSKKVRLLTGSASPDGDNLAGGDSIGGSIGGGGAMSVSRGGQGGAITPTRYPQYVKAGAIKKQNVPISSFKRDDDFTENRLSDTQVSPSAGVLTVAKKHRVHSQFDELQEAYLLRRRQVARMERQKQMIESVKLEKDRAGPDSYRNGLDDFQSVLTAFTRYSRLRVIAELHHGDLFHSSNIVSSIEFDRDDELFATAGVSRRIKVFEFATVVNELADVHCPVVEIPTRSKLSCLSWNKCIKPHIASSDYEGIVTVWDVTTQQSIMEYEEHEKRAWSVDFSRTAPSMLVSGSDDGKVKVWSTREETSVLNIDMKANICCVKYNPGSSNHIAVGSADHHIHYFDIRNSSAPLFVFKGHRKAVSYVKFISPHELASASTDSTLRLWDVQKNLPTRTLKGHTNEKNFVGLTVNSEYIACGSETNEVYVYHKAMSRPASCHRFGSNNPEDSDDDASHFISAVCWKSESPTMLAANSQGTIKVLVQAP